MEKESYDILLIKIMRSLSGTYQLFLDTIYGYEKEKRVEFLEYLQKSLTDEFVNIEMFEYRSNLPHYHHFDMGSEYYVKNPDFQQQLLLKNKGEEVDKIRREIPALLKKLRPKKQNVDLRDEDNDINSDKELNKSPEYLRINTKNIEKNQFIKCLFDSLQGSYISTDEGLFNNHFEKDYDGTRIIWLKSDRVLVLLVQALNTRYILNSKYLDIIQDHFLNNKGKQFNRNSLTSTANALGKLKTIPDDAEIVDNIIEDLKNHSLNKK